MNFYLVRHENGKYLAGIDQDGNPIFVDSPDACSWSWSQERLQNYLDDNKIEGATVVAQDSSGQNNPPNAPPF